MSLDCHSIECYLTATWLSLKCHLAVTRLSLDCHSIECHLTATWLSLKCHFAVTRLSLGCHLSEQVDCVKVVFVTVGTAQRGPMAHSNAIWLPLCYHSANTIFLRLPDYQWIATQQICCQSSATRLPLHCYSANWIHCQSRVTGLPLYYHSVSGRPLKINGYQIGISNEQPLNQGTGLSLYYHSANGEPLKSSGSQWITTQPYHCQSSVTGLPMYYHS